MKKQRFKIGQVLTIKTTFEYQENYFYPGDKVMIITSPYSHKNSYHTERLSCKHSTFFEKKWYVPIALLERCVISPEGFHNHPLTNIFI